MFFKSLRIKQVPYLFTGLCFALVSLLAIQVAWLSMSKNLIEEQFDQKVNLAIGNALTDFNSKNQNNVSLEDNPTCRDTEELKYLPIEEGFLDNEEQNELEESLGMYIARYGIDEKYSVDVFQENCAPQQNTYCCSLAEVAGCSDDYMLGVSFGSRKEYLYDKMSSMILASVLIFILLAGISFLILWSLAKQKKLGEEQIDFFNNTAHELKTPLTNISLASKLLKTKSPEKDGKKYLEIIETEQKKLTEHIEKVLCVTQLESGQEFFKKEKINLTSLIQHVCYDMKWSCQAKNGTILSLSDNTHPIFINGDHYHISNVIRNLIDNAVKYSKNNPRIEISLEEQNEIVELKIADNGIGIRPEDQNHIFEKYRRVETGNTQTVNGFGIGLAYVKTVIEKHKGLVKVESQLNKGSTFYLQIPLA